MALNITPSVGGSPNPTFNTMIPLALTDPDSLGFDPFFGRIVLDSQADGKLVFIRTPGPSQTVSVLSLTLFNDKDGPTTPVDLIIVWYLPLRERPESCSCFSLMRPTRRTGLTRASFMPGDAYSCAQGLFFMLGCKLRASDARGRQHRESGRATGSARHGIYHNVGAILSTQPDQSMMRQVLERIFIRPESHCPR